MTLTHILGFVGWLMAIGYCWLYFREKDRADALSIQINPTIHGPTPGDLLERPFRGERDLDFSGGDGKGNGEWP